MLCHMSKRHKHHEARPVNQADCPFDKHTDAEGGLPQCSHCHTKLRDFSSLRKHINERRCKVLFPVHPRSQVPSPYPGPPQFSNPTQTENLHLPSTTNTSDTPNAKDETSGSYVNRPEATPAATVRQSKDVAGQKQKEQRDASHSGREPTEFEEHLPYFRRTRVQNLLATHSENAAFHLQDRQWLRQHCALCSQWIACHSKVKQHYRLSHQAEFGMCAEEARLAV